MGRTIVADERVQKCIDDLPNKEEWILGLLIGQSLLAGEDIAGINRFMLTASHALLAVEGAEKAHRLILGIAWESLAVCIVVYMVTEQRDYVVHLVRTPPDTESDGGKAKTGSLETVDDGWVTTHARQVLRMLPGGLDIIGIFAMATQDTMKSAQLPLRKVLFAVQKMLNKTETCPIHGDRAVLNICSLTKKVTCRTFDTTDIKSAARPAEWKVQSIIGNWATLDSSLTMDHTILVSRASLSQTLNKQIQVGVSPLVSRIRKAVTTIDGQLRPDGDPLNTTPAAPQGKKSKKVQKEVKEATRMSVQLLLSMSGEQDGKSGVLTTDCGAQMRLCGTMSCRAFVHGKATVRDAVQAVKKDAVRTLLARCDLLCEDLLQAEEEQDPRVLYETPVRIHSSVPGTSLCFSDYMFQDETASDSTDRFKELLNLEVTEDDLEMDVEHVPTESDVSVADESQGDASEGQSESSTKDKTFNMIGAAIGTAVALLAAGFSYMYIGE